MADKFVFSNFATSSLREPISANDDVLLINIDDVPKFPALVGGAKFPVVLAISDEQYEIMYASALSMAGEMTVERGKEGTQAQSFLAGTHVRHTLTSASVIAAAGLRPRGNWSATVQYSQGDLIVSGGIAYVATQDSLNQAPSGASAYWQLFYQPPGAAATALNFLGAWSNSVTYAIGQAVIRKGRLWQANAANLGSEPAFGNANWTHIAKWSGPASYEGVLAFAGTNNYTVTIAAADAPSVLYDGLTVRGRFANSNTSNATLAINALAATPLRWKSGVDLAAGDIQAGELYEFTYVEATSEFIAKSVPGQTRLSLPVGAIIDWPIAGSIPAGWLYCNGQQVSRTTYAALFAKLGTSYGSGDGSTTFHLPNYTGRCRYTREGMGGAAHQHLIDTYTIASATMGAVGGSQHMGTHNHGVTDPGHTHAVHDPIHTHSGVTDLQGNHQHSYSAANSSGTAGSGATNPTAWNITAQNTGFAGAHTHNLSINGSVSGVYIDPSYSLVTVNNFGIGTFGNMPPLAIVDTIIFAGA